MAVPRLPVLYWKDLAKRHLRLERSLRLDKLKTVADAMHMDVDADRRQVETDCDGEIRRLAADAGKLAKFLDCIREDSAEFLLEDFRKRFKMLRFVVIETNGEDQLLYFLYRQPLKVFRGEASALRLCEEPPHSTCGTSVLRAGGENSPDEDTERIVSLRLDKFDDRRRMRLEFLLQRKVDFWYVTNLHTDS